MVAPQISQGSLTREAVSATSWSAGFQIGQQFVQFGISILLARLLTPGDFGLVAMANVIIGFAGVLGDLGLGSAIVQKKDVQREHLDSIFWLNLGLGLVIFVLLAVIAPLAAIFYREPRVAAIIVVSATSFVFGPLSMVQTTILRKELRFKTLGVRQLMVILPSSVISVWLAFSGWGAWSLVLGGLLNPLLTAVVIWNTVSWHPSFTFSTSKMRELMRFSLGLTGFSLFNYLMRNADNLLIGRYLGDVPLGLYDRAYNLMLMPLNRVTRVLGPSLFPIFSRLQDDNLRFQRAYIRVCRTVALVTFPLCIGLWVLLKPTILLLYGPQWVEIVPLLQWLVLVGMDQSIGALVGHIYMAKGRTDWMLIWGIASGLLAIPAFVIGLQWGLLGVVIAYSVWNFALELPSSLIPFRLIQLSYLHWLGALVEILVYSLIMGIGMYIVRIALEQMDKSVFEVVFGSGVVGMLIYGLLIRWRHPPELDELRRAVPLERIAWLARFADLLYPPVLAREETVDLQ